VVGPPYHYLMFWMTVLPVLPLLGAAVGLEGIWSAWARGAPDRAALLDAGSGGAGRRVLRPGSAIAAVAVLALSGLALRGVVRATPAAALTDKDIATLWRLAAPVVGPGHQVVRVEIADGNRWPAAAGLGLELERHGHPVRVDRQWTLLFGDKRFATGQEPIALIVGTDATAFPPAASATLLGQAGPDVLWVRRAGTTCWTGWVPLGGPACPPLVAPEGPAVPAPPALSYP
jgi:hypothetical protein